MAQDNYLQLAAIVTTLMVLPVALINSYTLQWLRKEIDDYRGRIINYFIFPAGVETGSGQGVLFFAKTVRTIREKSKVRGLQSRTNWYSLRDNALIDHLSWLENQVKDLQGLVIRLGTGEVVDYLSTKSVLEKRIGSKNQVKLYLLLSLSVFGALLLHLIWRASPTFWQKDGFYILIIIFTLMVYFLVTLQNHT